MTFHLGFGQAEIEPQAGRRLIIAHPQRQRRRDLRNVANYWLYVIPETLVNSFLRRLQWCFGSSRERIDMAITILYLAVASNLAFHMQLIVV